MQIYTKRRKLLGFRPENLNGARLPRRRQPRSRRPATTGGAPGATSRRLATDTPPCPLPDRDAHRSSRDTRPANVPSAAPLRPARASTSETRISVPMQKKSFRAFTFSVFLLIFVSKHTIARPNAFSLSHRRTITTKTWKRLKEKKLQIS